MDFITQLGAYVQIIKECENIKFFQKYSIQFQEVLYQIQELNSGYKCFLILFIPSYVTRNNSFLKMSFFIIFYLTIHKIYGDF